MKKYVTALTILTSALVFSGISWADDIGKDAEGDVLHGHGAVNTSEGKPYVKSESRSNETGSDLLSNPQDYSSSSPSKPAEVGVSNHDDHEDTVHIIAHH